MGQLIFLGGTCGNNDWRDGLIERMVARGVPAAGLFNPVVADWNEEAQRREDEAKKTATWDLYYLGDPRQESNHVSFYSLLEATIGLYDHPERTVVVFDITGMPDHAAKASRKCYKDLRARFPDAHIFESLDDAEQWILATTGLAAA